MKRFSRYWRRKEKSGVEIIALVFVLIFNGNRFSAS